MKFWLFIFAFLVASLTAISNESLWIDEATTAWQASLPSMKACWNQMMHDRGSELQMPLFMAYLWAWEKWIGSSEWLLRLSNLPWLLLGFGALLKAFSENRKLRFGVFFVTALSPFVWFYLNEARPYIMQLGGTFLILAALYRLNSAPELNANSQRRWTIGLAAGMFIICGSSLLGVIWLGAGLMAALLILGPKRVWNLVKPFPIIWLVTLAVMLSLGTYFAWTLTQGARASGSAGTDWKNLLFVGYEFLGFSGLGPGRLEIRTQGLSAMRPYAVVLGGYAVILFVLLRNSWREREKFGSQKVLFWSAFFLIAATACLFALGFVAHFRVLGRHFTPLIVAVLVWVGFGWVQLLTRPGIFPKIFAIAFVGFNFYSCISLRFAEQHRKDDYRSAAEIAKVAVTNGKSVWWNADRFSALYYHVPIQSENSIGSVHLINHAAPDSLPNAAPDIVLVSKPDVYDGQNAVGQFLAKERYEKTTVLPAFSVWEKPLR